MLTIQNIAIEPDYTLSLTYSNGATIVADFKPLIAQDGVYAALSDPAYFAQVQVGERGRYIQWPGELDFCADALWLDAQAGTTSAA